MLMIKSLAFIGGLGGPEIAVIFVVVLLLFGAKKIPELARGLGKSMGEFKRARDEFEDEIKMAEMDVSNEAETNEPETKEAETKKAEHREEASEVS
jgi:TatA/E family protein of Tat protein translocase